jgi:DnaJ homolog subfamily C member 30
LQSDKISSQFVCFKGDIKSAYYKLSKICHPDHNKDAEAADRFREITEAYEVLGNFRLRKLYDKGIIHTAGEKYAQQPPTPEEEENDPTTRFYKARMKKEHTTATGRTPIYDFDAWTNSHYGGERDKKKKLKETKIHREKMQADEARKTEVEMFLLPLLLIFVIFAVLGKPNHDEDRLKDKAPSKDIK